MKATRQSKNTLNASNIGYVHDMGPTSCLAIENEHPFVREAMQEYVHMH